MYNEAENLSKLNVANLGSSVKLLTVGQILDIDLAIIGNIIFGQACDYLIEKNDFKGFRAWGGETAIQKDFAEVREIMADVKILKNLDETSQKKLKIIEDGLGSVVNPNIRQIDELDSQLKDIKIMKNELLKTSELNLAEVVWGPSKFHGDDNFKVSIKKGTLGTKQIACKAYTITLENDRKNIETEINILTLLSNRALDDNLYIKFYSAKIENNTISLYMEAHDMDLDEHITKIKPLGEKIPPELVQN